MGRGYGVPGCWGWLAVGLLCGICLAVALLLAWPLVLALGTAGHGLQQPARRTAHHRRAPLPRPCCAASCGRPPSAAAPQARPPRRHAPPRMVARRARSGSQTGEASAAAGLEASVASRAPFCPALRYLLRACDLPMPPARHGPCGLPAPVRPARVRCGAVRSGEAVVPAGRPGWSPRSPRAHLPLLRRVAIGPRASGTRRPHVTEPVSPTASQPGAVPHWACAAAFGLGRCSCGVWLRAT